jgi:ferredoxin
VGWKVKTVPEPETSECAACTLCLPWLQGGGQRANDPWVVCPWRACTMCDECARVCPDKAIYTLPLPTEEAPETTEELRAPTSEPVSYEQFALELPAVPFC